MAVGISEAGFLQVHPYMAQGKNMFGEQNKQKIYNKHTLLNLHQRRITNSINTPCICKKTSNENKSLQLPLKYQSPSVLNVQAKHNGFIYQTSWLELLNSERHNGVVILLLKCHHSFMLCVQLTKNDIFFMLVNLMNFGMNKLHLQSRFNTQSYSVHV